MRRSHRLVPAFLAVLALTASVPAWAAIEPPPAAPGARVLDQRAEALRLFREQKHAEAAELYGKLAQANPYDGSLWAQWGYCLHAVKRWDDALPAYDRAIALGQNVSGNLYNKACALALMGKKDDAFGCLEKALNHRFAEQEILESDTDWDALRDDPRFAQLTGITRALKEKPAANRDDGWKWDLDFYARRMKQMHYDLYTKVPEKTFRAELDRLKSEIGTLTDDQARARLRKITAMVGDGHTQSMLSPEGAAAVARLPLHLYAFKDGLFIIGAAKEHESLVGSKVLKLGPLSADAAMAATRPYLSVDNDMGYLAGGPAILTNPIILAEIGAMSSSSGEQGGVELTIAAPGSKETTVRVAPVEMPRVRGGQMTIPTFTYATDACKDPLPLYRRDPEKLQRTEFDPARRLAYFYFGAIQDGKQQSLADASRELFESIEKNRPDYLVVDMRFNGGGNTGLIRPFINGLTAWKPAHERGHLFVIIGRGTFSAAQNTVNLIDANTAATFVGEPTGSRPHFIGESTSFVLPHSKTRVYCSSRYWQVLDSTDERCWIPPEIPAEMTFADYANNRDPAMEAVYAAITGPSGTP